MRMTGHAGYAEKGQDIVCAAASMLWYTLAEGMREQERMGHGTADIESDEIAFLPADGCGDAALIFRTIWKGLERLAEAYEEYIRCEMQE
ncbi:MAG: ribosomal-processing cysteine protease Prp [Clostridiales bacterium]|nr:ribosomal-processing cysteine protease Prp [Candidatus Cacconaster stercorequi]